ncbi:hypothetical protein [Chryseobacterium sp. ISL-6]|uniref:hypothetical protein n=1 Tax=Chryseobacterium sp. ISL-6 TaxID=2819143 RepID=UPI001BE7705A|nr:hypothetical protein [Chryseobacterium sp. ISL-6]MBT2622656.1 hypothetical protein [Chryseobacterium sp. ISL-6]
MKVLTKVFATVILPTVMSAGAFAQSKIIAVVKSANWCSVCKANEERAMAALTENNKDGAYQFVINDITGPETAKKIGTRNRKTWAYKIHGAGYQLH